VHGFATHTIRGEVGRCVSSEPVIWPADGIVEPMSGNFGNGPGAITPDGCAVEVYARLPATGEPEIASERLPAGASVLDLGAGVGRVADVLVDLGHQVVAVDESADMLARVRAAATVRSRIEDLRLSGHFDACLLASFLLNTPDAEQRHSFLATARHHLAPGGNLLAQWHPPEWFDSLTVGGSYPGGARYVPGHLPDSDAGGVVTNLTVNDIDNGLLTAVVTYELHGQRWTHGWQAQRLSLATLERELQSCGLRLEEFLTDDRTWLCATAVGSP